MRYQWRKVGGFEYGEPLWAEQFNLVRDGEDVLSVRGHEKPIIDQLIADVKVGGEFTTEIELFGGGNHLGNGVWEVNSQSSGSIYKVNFHEGDSVLQSNPIVILEALLMLNPIVAPVSGIIEQVAVTVGQFVEEGQLLFQLKAA